jgi:hypothetical protein
MARGASQGATEARTQSVAYPWRAASRERVWRNDSASRRYYQVDGSRQRGAAETQRKALASIEEKVSCLLLCPSLPRVDNDREQCEYARSLTVKYVEGYLSRKTTQ